MEKMKMETANIAAQNVEKIEALFPNCVTEALDEEKSTDEKKVYKKVVNFDMLRQMLSEQALDGDEAYEFTWVGKKAAIVEANKPIRKTLRPCKEESVDWDNTENLYIEGDNLEVLKLLQESYLGKVKMIYIDPPYNTGHDFVYPDSFIMESEDYDDGVGYFDDEGNVNFKRENSVTAGRYHSDWCSMIYSRLLLARNILKDDGCIFISISDIEAANLKKICDDVFGSANFVADLIWANKEGGGSSDTKLFRIKHEHIICYAKNIDELEIKGVPISNAERYKGTDQYESERGKFYLQKLGMGSIQYSASLDYPIIAPDGTTVMPADNNNGRKACWRWSKEKYERNKNRGFIEIKKDSKGIWTVYTKQYMNCDNDGNPIERTQRPMGIIEEFSSTQAAKMLESMGLGGLFSYSKPTALINYLISRLNLNNEIVMDFFSGSATTAHSVMLDNMQNENNIHYIMVQLPEKCDVVKENLKTISDIGRERIRRAGNIIKNEKPMIAQKLDVGFRVFKLDESNMNDVYYGVDQYNQSLLSLMESNIKEDRTDMDLLFGCLLDWGLPLSLPYSSETIDGCSVHNYNDGDLIACFDENVPESVIKFIAKKQPIRAVFRDSSFEDSPSKINVGEIFKMLAPDTRVKVI